MAQQPPRRPTTRVSPPASGKSPTSRQPAVKPSTQAMHKAPTTRAQADPPPRSPTRSMARHATSRGGASKKSSLPLILGGVGGALLLIVILAVAMGGGTKKAPPASNAKAPKPVDVASIERDAEAKCEQGMGIVQKCEGLMTGRELNAGEKVRLKDDLQKGLNLLVEGMSGFDKANSMAGKTYDVVKYSKTIKAARMKLGELGSK
jgi:hypothetical protein